MSDERIEKALRQGPPAEPAYMAQLTPADLHGSVSKAPRSKSAFSFFAGLAETAVAAGLVVAVVGIVLIRSGAFETAAKPSTRLADIQARGVIRIAVRPDRPQVTAPGGARSGFDVDVATEIGRRLGLRVELDFTPADEMLAGRGEWDIALPSSAVEPGAFATTTPYYDWPVRLIVPAGSTAAATGRPVGIDDLCRDRKRGRGLARRTVPRHERDTPWRSRQRPRPCTGSRRTRRARPT